MLLWKGFLLASLKLFQHTKPFPNSEFSHKWSSLPSAFPQILKPLLPIQSWLLFLLSSAFPSWLSCHLCREAFPNYPSNWVSRVTFHVFLSSSCSSLSELLLSTLVMTAVLVCVFNTHLPQLKQDHVFFIVVHHLARA